MNLQRLTGSLAVGAYCLITLALTYPLLLYFDRALPGDGFDGWQNYWNLWWVKKALVDAHTHPFFTPLLYHPTGVSLLFHTLNVFNGLLTLPIQLAWGLFPAYNTVVLFSFAIGGTGTYLLARRVLGPGQDSRLPAFVAGAIFTFAPVHFAHLLGHLQVLSLEWIPFYALYLMRIVDRTGRGQLLRDIAMASLFLVLVALCDWYFVMYCLILTVIVLVWAAWRAVRKSHQAGFAAAEGQRAMYVHIVLGTAISWLLFAVILSPLLLPMVGEALQFRFMVPNPEQSQILSADMLAFFTPQEFHPLWGAWARERASVFTASVSEHQVFAGFTALALAALGLWAGGSGNKRQGSIRGPWPLALVVFFVLALGPVLHLGGKQVLMPGGQPLELPYTWLVSHVPFMDITRSVSRFDVMVMLVIAVLAAIGVRYLLNKGKAGWWSGILALGLVLFEFLPIPYPLSMPDTPYWYHELAADPRPGAVLNLPMNWDRPGYLLYQTEHGKPLTVAYISREDPRTLTERVPVLQHFRRLGPDIIDFDMAAQGRQVLHDLGVRWVVLDRYKMPGERERTYNEETAQKIFEGTLPVYEDQRLTVYEVIPSQEEQPYLILGTGWAPFDVESASRSFMGSTTVYLHTPEAGRYNLRITLAPESAPLDLPRDGDQYLLTFEAQPGTNELSLRGLDDDSRIMVTTLVQEALP